MVIRFSLKNDKKKTPIRTKEKVASLDALSTSDDQFLESMSARNRKNPARPGKIKKEIY